MELAEESAVMGLLDVVNLRQLAIGGEGELEPKARVRFWKWP